METNAFSNAAPRLDIDPQTLPIEALEDEITTLSASITVATWRLLVLIAELDRRGKWGSWGLASCAHWLNWKCGIALGAAREKVRVAHALAGLPKVSDALSRGELSYSKARAITRVATPESQDYLLMIARHGTASHVEKLVRAYRHVERLQESARATQRTTRSVHCAGASRMTVRWSSRCACPPSRAHGGAGDPRRRRCAMARARRCRSRAGTRGRRFRGNVGIEPSSNSFDNAESPVSARRADALCHVAEQFLAHEAVTHARPNATRSWYTWTARCCRSDGHGDCCHIEHGGAIAAGDGATTRMRRLGRHTEKAETASR
jgi:hypothetical protein